jgi:hypothetical chaperone protein
VYEPVAAAFFYAQTLEDSATVLVADFGGGTTDYLDHLLRARRGGLRAEALGHAGVGIAGDRFDYRIIDHVVLPQLGKGTTYRSMGKQPGAAALVLRGLRALARAVGDEDLARLPRAARRWRLQRRARARGPLHAPGGIGPGLPALQGGVGSEGGAVARRGDRFSFHGRGLRDRARHHAREFESWIEPELEAIEEALEEALANASIATRRGPRVPHRRQLVRARGAPHLRAPLRRGRVEAGNEFVSIANGLATIGLREDVERGSRRAQ